MSSIPKTMKAAQCLAPGKGLTVHQIPVPTPGKGQVLVKVEASSVCHSDAAVIEGHFPGLSYPITPGHEVVGRIVQRGPDVPDRYSEGSRIGVGWHGGHCFWCDPCRKGHFINCKTEKITGVTFNGGYAEYLVVGFEAIAFIPEDLDAAETAPLLCAGVTVFNGIRKHGYVGPGDIVAVVGMGGLGALALQFAVNFGLRVIAISSSASKKDLCLKAGVAEEDYIDASKEDPIKKLQSLGGAKCVVVTAPDPKETGRYTAALGIQGTLLALSVLGQPVPVNTLDLIQKDSHVQGHASGTAIDSEECVKFARTKNIKTIVERFTLDQAQEAYQKMLDGKVRFRAVFTFDK